MPEPQQITSALYKALQLSRASSYFPALVEAAAMIQGKTYTPSLLMWAASRPAVTTAITITITDGQPSSVDTVLEQLMIAAGEAVDSVILAAVASYTGGA